MILKRQEKNGVVKAMYASSTICASIFNTENKDLTVIFNNGGQYKYSNVSLTDYTRFETSESNGSDFDTYIKKKYTNFEKLDKLSSSTIEAILKEVEELKTAEDSVSVEVKSKAMMEMMANLVATYIGTGKISDDSLNKLGLKITEYKSITSKKPTE